MGTDTTLGNVATTNVRLVLNGLMSNHMKSKRWFALVVVQSTFPSKNANTAKPTAIEVNE